QHGICDEETEALGITAIDMDIHIHCYVYSVSGTCISLCDVIPSQKKQDPFLVCYRRGVVDGGTCVICFLRLFFWCVFSRNVIDTRRICYILHRWKWLVIESC